MCWSPEASLTLGVAGIATAAYVGRHKEKRGWAIALAFFSVMEFIQFFSYSSIDQCGAPANQWATYLSYAHIILQPIFFNMIYISMLGWPLSARTKRYIYSAAGFFSAILFVKIIPFSSAALCRVGETLCGVEWCTVHGSWHLAWQVPMYTWPLPGDILIWYALAVFVVPLFYGAWRGVLFALIGPVVAYATTQNPNEWPAVWCLFSVALMLLMLAGDSVQNKLFPRTAAAPKPDRSRTRNP
jgi:hypothetical protein